MWQWIWENISNIDSIVSIIAVILSGGVFIGGVVYGLITSILRLKLKRNQYKYLNLVVDNQTKQSMKYYIPTRAQSTDPCDEKESHNISNKIIPFFIKNVFTKSDNQYFIILADSGMGKTTFLLKLFFTYYKKILRQHEIVFIPLSLASSIEKIREVKNKTNTILLLDGFDEDQYAMEEYSKRLKDICNETELFYKVIMTCRTQFFPNNESEPKYIDKIKFGVGKKSVEFIKYYISPFNNREIYFYLIKKYNPIYEIKKIIRSYKIITNCPKLMIRPMLLAYLDDLLIDSTKEYYYAYEIYSELVFRWIEREAVDNKVLYVFSEKIAEYMYYHKTVYITISEIERLCEDYDIQIQSIEAKSRSLLNRNSNGTYKFAHKSILEYFLAKKAYDEIEFRKVVTFDAFSGYDMLKTFLGEMDQEYISKQEKLSVLKSLSCKYFQLSRNFFMVKSIEDCDFEGTDFSGAYFGMTDFEMVTLVDANLQGAELQGTCIRRSNLARADLRGANLKKIKLNNVILTETLFDESQVEQLENKYNLQDTKVYIAKTKEIINYVEYRKRR